MDYKKFENWKNTHATEMRDLTFAKPYDFFIFTRFTQKSTAPIEGKQIVFAETIEEAMGYIRHIFLYDILNDMTDDLEFDPINICNKSQADAVKILYYWFKLGKIADMDSCDSEFCKFCDDFNAEFSNAETAEYEIQILKGANQLQKFLTKRYSHYENFDKKRLSSFCSKELFAGKPLKDFVDLLFE